MLLAWLDAHPPIDANVVDVGTGSGILAVAAARLGARAVTAVDIDPAAVVTTEANAARNGVSGRVRASTTPVGDLPTACADLVLVNVTAGAHARIGHQCAGMLRTGGILLVAGLLPGQWIHVADAYRDLTKADGLILEGWEGAALRRA
jgi:ribosomal protein L11 methyltransferase